MGNVEKTFFDRSKSAGILIGKEGKRLSLLKALEDLVQKDGPELTMLLRNSECSDMQNRYCTCKDFLGSSLSVYKTIELTKDKDPLAFLQLRINFLKILRKEFESYFSNGPLEDFEIFVPEKLPRTVSQALTHGLREIQTFAERFELNARTASKE